MIVYADNAATTKISKTALDAMLPMFNEVYGNPSSLHTVGQTAKAELEKA
ncbi:MAG: aminotransferase class V-fold PLP-dependent enzyme, partial [Oscillospiraceae bacterium]